MTGGRWQVTSGDSVIVTELKWQVGTWVYGVGKWGGRVSLVSRHSRYFSMANLLFKLSPLGQLRNFIAKSY